MRIPDSNGPWKQHPEEPRLLVRRDPTEVGGTNYRVLTEGMLDNWAGLGGYVIEEGGKEERPAGAGRSWRAT
jgi:hypothetical protein